MTKKALGHYRSLLSLILVAAMSYLAIYLLNLFLANHLSEALYGDFSVGLKASIFASTFILLGTNVSNNKFFQEYRHEPNHDKLHTYLKWNFSFLRKSIMRMRIAPAPSTQS